MPVNQYIQDFVRVYDNIYSEQLCDEIVQEYAESEYIPAAVGDQVSPHLRHVDEISLSLPNSNNSYTRQILLTQIRNGIQNVISQYREPFKYFYVENDTGFQLLKYKTGHYYKQHVDIFRPVADQNIINAILDMNLTPEDLLKYHGSGQPALSCSILLNNDFEGGELGFWDNTFKIKPTKGSVVVFPSNFMYPHQVSKITKGTRYVIVTWLI